MGPDQMQGWRRRISFDDIHWESRYIPGFRAEEAVRFAVPNQKWTDAKEVLRAGPGKSPHAVADEFSVAAAVSYIRERFASPYYDKERREQPILLKVSLLLPHYPYFCSEEKFRYYVNRVEPFLDEPVFDHPALSRRQVRVGEDVIERDVRRATAAYYGMVETIDEQYGQVLDALREVGQDLDDWIIVYTSDHGEMLGEHGVWEKQKFFEASARVPLIIRLPKRFGARTAAENVNLCDLYATLAELAGLPVPEGLDSRSLVPLMLGEHEHWDNETVSEFWGEHLMIKRDHLKYQYYGPDAAEVLFDLERDPRERTNFAGEARYTSEMDRFRARRVDFGF
jgi:choline-sulfatase